MKIKRLDTDRRENTIFNIFGIAFIISIIFVTFFLPKAESIIYRNVPRIILTLGLSITSFMNYRRTEDKLARNLLLVSIVLFIVSVILFKDDFLLREAIRKIV